MINDQELVATNALDFQEQAPEKDFVFPRYTQKQLGWQDIKESFIKWRIWLMLAYQDIKLRYRRSVLGPFWLTISMAITVYSMGFLYSKLFHIEMENYYPFLVSGMLCWSLISTLITDYTDGLVTTEGLIKQIKLPYTLHIHRIAAKNIIIFFHNIIVMIPIMLIYPKTAPLNLNTLLLFPGLLVIYFNSLTYGMVISMIGARYRDMSQIIKSFVQIIFFITPIMWKPETINEKYHYLFNLNPVYAFLELIRAPLLGKLTSLPCLMTALVATLVGFYFSYYLFCRYRARIVYWL